jgi:hypothetical protein
MVIPTRRRETTMPIDSSTRIASRATLRDTRYSALTPSRLSTWPGDKRSDTIPAPRAVSKLPCNSSTIGDEDTYTT